MPRNYEEQEQEDITQDWRESVERYSDELIRTIGDNSARIREAVEVELKREPWPYIGIACAGALTLGFLLAKFIPDQNSKSR